MSYRRVRSYRRRDARQARIFADKPRRGRVPMAALLAVALAAGIAIISVPQLRTMLTASSTATGQAGNCAPAAAAGAAGPAAPGDATAGAAAGVEGSAVADGAASSAPATSPPATPASSQAATPAQTSPAAPDTSAPGVGQTAAPTPTGPAVTPDPAPDSSAATPCPSGTAGASAAAATPAVNPEAGQPGLAGMNPVDPAGNPISLNQTAAQAADTLNCTLIVPARPLRARGLATPWRLGDGCSEANPNEAAFVEATILAPNGRLTVYNPLVITQGTTPAVRPARPRIPRGSHVIIEVGFNGNNVVLEGSGAARGRCIDAFGNSIISQTPACNAPAFYAAANSQIARGTLKIPALGMANDGQMCETTRSFSLIDQDQSDNVASQYLLNANGQTAQNTAANKATMGGSTVISNGSDEGLLARFVDPALGCTPFQAPDTTNPNGVSASQALNELSARQNQHVTPALLPVNNPQLLVAGQFSIGKTNTFRMMTDQPLLPASTNKNQNAATYCQDMVNTAPAKLQLDQKMEAGFATPVPDIGDTLATFLGARLSASFTNLGCQNFGLTNPVTVTTDGNGVATAVTYDTSQQQGQVPPGMSGGKHRHHRAYNRVPAGRSGHKENAAGM